MGLKNYLKKGVKKIRSLFKRVKLTLSRGPKKGRKKRLKSLLYPSKNQPLLVFEDTSEIRVEGVCGEESAAALINSPGKESSVIGEPARGSDSSSNARLQREKGVLKGPGGLPPVLWNGPSNSLAADEFSAVQLSAHTRRAYQNDLRDFFKFLLLRFGASSQLSSFSELSPAVIAEYRDFLIQEKKLGQNSVTRKLAVLKSFFKYALSRGWIAQNPAEFVRGFRQNQESKTGFLNDEEVLRLLSFVDALPEERLSFFQTKVLIKTLVFLGLRRSEAQAIRLGHVEYSDGFYHLRVQGKGSRERRLPLSPSLLESWARWIRRILHGEEIPKVEFLDSPAIWLGFLKKHAEQPLFINTRARSFDQPLSTSEMGLIVRKVGRKAGIAFRVSPHMLRATAITNALDAGATHRGVQQMAGWTSPLMISRYDKRLNDPKFSAVFHIKYAGWSTVQQTVKLKTESVEDFSTRDEGSSLR